MRSKTSMLFVCIGLVASTAGAAAPSPVSVQLELSQRFYYEGEPLQLRIVVRNNAPVAVPNPIKTPLFAGFKVGLGAGGPVEASGKPSNAEPIRPDSLSAQAFYGGVLDIGEIYPGLRKRGTYRIHWSADGHLSDQIIVKIIPKYDPSSSYTGRIVTDHGAIDISLFGKQSPLAVRAFIDMANAGFYEGLQFHEVHSDTYVVGGSPAFGGTSVKPFLYPAEQSSLPLVAGTVVMKPAGAAPPANGSEFIILLKPQPAWSGQVTVLGHVVEGFDVVRRISRAPRREQGFRPRNPTVIRSVEVREAPGRAASSP